MKIRLVMVVVLGVLFAAAAQAAMRTDDGPNLVSRLAAVSARVSPTDPATVRFTLTNSGTESALVLKWQTPLFGIEADLFRVEFDGEPATYTGKLVKRAAPQAEDYLEILPGETYAVDVDLAQVYDLSVAGDYAIRFRSRLDGVRTRETAVQDLEGDGVSVPLAKGQVVESNPVAMWIDERPEAIQVEMESIGGYTGGCTSSEISALQTAYANATTMSTKAYNWTVSHPTGGSLYTLWFGSFNSSRFSTVKTHYNSLKTTFSTKTFTMDCGCSENYYAYVYPSQPYKVYLCNAFWQAPATGRDSKAGTLVHETSHFYVVASTQDYVYGATGAQQLARTNPKKAIKNADNHEYFAEDQP